MIHRYTKYPIILMILALSGCNMPLCDDGEVICTYGLQENCTSENTEDCACNPDTDAHCISASTRRQYLAKCQLNVCKNNVFQSTKPCEYGFDGENCMTECEPGEFKCTDNDGNDVQMYDEVPCAFRTCNSDGQWSKSSTNCSNGYNANGCIPECQPGKTKCTTNDGKIFESSTTEPCMLSICGTDSKYQKTSKTCLYGYDGKDCLTECQPGFTKCINDNGEEVETYTTQSCMLSICEADGYYQKTPKPCLYGYDGKDCLPECKNGESRCIDAKGTAVAADDPTHPSCELKRCTNQQWPETSEKTCKFGYNGSDCINPCIINDVSYEFLAGTIQDSTVSYKCTQTDGWDIDNSCTNDFIYHTHGSQDVVQIPTWAISENLTATSPETGVTFPTNLKPGICGECNSNTTPFFCIENDNQKIISQCQNGQMIVGADTTNQCDDPNLTVCTDNYGQTIYVNLNNNRYHCGSCETTCASIQDCINGTCQSKVDKNSCIDGYTIIQNGARVIRAYCIETLDEFKNIGERFPDDNYDNAFILVNEEPFVFDNWDPIGDIESPFKGMLFGNGRTFNINNINPGTSIQDDQYTGIFGALDNAYINGLTLKYTGEAQVALVSKNQKTGYWGLLAGYATNSTIQNIIIDVPEQTSSSLVSSVDHITAGGLVGAGINLTLSNITITSFNLVLNLGFITTPPSIGGLAGELNGSFVQKITASHISINSSNYTGGLFGILSFSDLSQIAINSVSMICNTQCGGLAGYIQDSSLKNIDASDIHLSKSEENVLEISGGLAGESRHNTIFNVEIGDIHISGYKYLGGLIGLSNTDTLSNISLKSVTITADGGALGGLIGHLIEGIISNITISDNNITDGFDTGGLAGELEKYNRISRVHIRNTQLNGYSNIGGLFGTVNEGIDDLAGITVESGNIYSESNSGTFIGFAMNARITMTACAAFGFIKMKSSQYSGLSFIGELNNSDLTLENNLSVMHIEQNQSNTNIFHPIGHLTENGLIDIQSFVYSLAKATHSDPLPFYEMNHTYSIKENNNFKASIFPLYSSLASPDKPVLCKSKSSSCYTTEDDCTANGCGEGSQTAKIYEIFMFSKCNVDSFLNLLCGHISDTNEQKQCKQQWNELSEDETTLNLPLPVYVDNDELFVAQPSFCE